MNPQDPEIPRPEGTIGISINRLDDISRMRRVFDASESSDDTNIPNVYGKKYFLVKFQVNVLEPNNPIAMYDRQRSFQTYFVRNSNPEVFDQFRAEIAGPRGGHHGLKVRPFGSRGGICANEIQPSTDVSIRKACQPNRNQRLSGQRTCGQSSVVM
jgi:hypothetical protein